MKPPRAYIDFRDRKSVFDVDGITFHMYRLVTVSSTMDVARVLAEDGMPPWTVVSSKTQTAGRGTKGREWFSPDGKGLWLSIILPLPERLDMAADVTLLAADALKKVLFDHCGLKCIIKHPNDLLIRGKKIAGIMVESVTSGSNPRCLILGMGLNLKGTREEYDSAGHGEAISVMLAGGTVPETDKILIAFLKRFVPLYNSVASTAFIPIHKGITPI